VRRRDVVLALGASGLSLAPFAARAQQTSMPVVAILSGTNHEARLIGAVKRGLSEAGFDEGKNVAFEYRFARGQFDQLPSLAADLVNRGVAVIVAMQSPTAPRAAQAATSTIPVVFSIGGDPVKLGLVGSLNRPGGNVTGATFLVNSLGAKRLEFLRELLPANATVGLLVNPKNPSAAPETADVQNAARTLGLQVRLQHASSSADIDTAFATFVEHKVNAVTFAADAVFNARRAQLIELAANTRLPTMYFYREFAVAGGLISYGGHDTDAYRLAGGYAARILKGEKPADLPVQQSTRVELVINLKTAKALGVDIPLSLVGRADEVIE
jgi:putative ABC transport system substrate-binding protein